MNAQTIYEKLNKYKTALLLEASKLEIETYSVASDSLAAILHSCMVENAQINKEAWANGAKALPKETRLNQLKNVYAVLDTIDYWINRFEKTEDDTRKEDILTSMYQTANYTSNRDNSHLENAATSQHQTWRKFVLRNQIERVTLGHKEYRADTFRQVVFDYANLTEPEKDKDRMVVAIVTDYILQGSINYAPKFKVHDFSKAN